MNSETISLIEHASLKKYLIRALLYHISIILFVLIVNLIMEKLHLALFEPKKNPNAVILASAIRVDVVAMPKLTAKELKVIEPTEVKSPETKLVEEKKVEVKEEPKVEPKSEEKSFKVVDDKKNFHDLLKKISKKNIALAKNDSAKKLEKENSVVIEGNKLSKGSSLTRGKNSEEQEALINYVSQITDAVRPFWRLPSYLMNKNLNARLQIFLSAKGELIRVSIYESSGNSEYDERAKLAIEQGAPYTLPNAEIKERVVKGDIILGFPL